MSMVAKFAMNFPFPLINLGSAQHGPSKFFGRRFPLMTADKDSLLSLYWTALLCDQRASA
jgi:hypothetical protein